jgi:hypothetical protein
MTHDPSGRCAASAVRRSPACGLGSRTSDRFRTETARLVTVAWAGASSRASGSHAGRRVCHRQFCPPRRKVGIGGGASWHLRRFRFLS